MNSAHVFVVSFRSKRKVRRCVFLGFSVRFQTVLKDFVENNNVQMKKQRQYEFEFEFEFEFDDKKFQRLSILFERRMKSL